MFHRRTARIDQQGQTFVHCYLRYGEKVSRLRLITADPSFTIGCLTGVSGAIPACSLLSTQTAYDKPAPFAHPYHRSLAPPMIQAASDP